MRYPFQISILYLKNGKMSKKILFALLGKNLSHSFSPLMFNFYFRKLNLNYHYFPISLPEESLLELLNKARNSSILGMNVTIPYKEKIIPLLDELDSVSNKIRAVNVIKNKNGRLIGYNTDFSGFKRALEKYNFLDLKRAVILGAGGAGRSVIYSLYTLNFEKIVFFSRTWQRINEIESNFSFINGLKGYLWDIRKIRKEIMESDVLINATPVGMSPFLNASPIEIDFPLKENFLAFDLIYNPKLTKLLKMASEKGSFIENGIDMLIFQAVEGLKIWLEKKINEELFIKTCGEVINASISNSR